MIRLKAGLIVSCQARPGSPFYGPAAMAAFARAAADGGAAGIRANGPADVAAIRAAVTLPVIGINKLPHGPHPEVITPTFASARAVVAAGADMVNASFRRAHWPEDGPLRSLVRRIREDLGVPVLADVGDLEEGVRAARLGADMVATTYALNGPEYQPDLDLLDRLVAALPGVPVVGEGNYWEPAHVAAAFRLGAHAVVVGTAITNPAAITALAGAAACGPAFAIGRQAIALAWTPWAAPCSWRCRMRAPRPQFWRPLLRLKEAADHADAHRC